MHSNRNLMDELKKIKRVAKPDFVFFVGDSLTGNDAINQAKTFEEEIGFDGIILAKSDVDQKGGAIISVSYVTGKPVYFLGMGQGYSDLKPFSKKEILKKII
jgi:fused signal recognition particle receptor